jgi:hypothetical protein
VRPSAESFRLQVLDPDVKYSLFVFEVEFGKSLDGRQSANLRTALMTLGMLVPASRQIIFRPQVEPRAKVTHGCVPAQ